MVSRHMGEAWQEMADRSGNARLDDSLKTTALSLLRWRKMPAEVSFPPYTVLFCAERRTREPR